MRTLGHFILFILFICLALLTTLFITLQTSYAPQLIQQLSSAVFSKDIHVQKVNYSYQDPWHITLENITVIPLKQQEALKKEPAKKINKVELWLTPKLYKQSQVQLEQLAIQGISLSLQDIKSLSNYSWLKINKLQIAQFNFSSQEGWFIRDGKVTLENPQFSSQNANNTHSFMPLGKIDFFADQIYWEGIALDKFFFDGKITPQASEIYGLSFKSGQGSVSAQGTQQADKSWEIDQLSIKNLNLEEKDLNKIVKFLSKEQTKHPILFKKINIAKSNIETQNVVINQLTANLEELNLEQKFWQQDNLKLTAHAQSIGIFGENFEKPDIKAEFVNHALKMDYLTLSGLKGKIDLTGTISPQELNLEQLNIKGVHWSPSKQAKKLWLEKLINLKKLVIKQLLVQDTYYSDISLPAKPQITELSLEGKHLSIVPSADPSSWKGSLIIGAKTATYDQITSKSPLIQLESKPKNKTLSRFVIPLDGGLIRGKGSIDLTQKSKPWSLKLSAMSVPLHLYNRWLQRTHFITWPLALDGNTKLKIDLHGLATDSLSFKNSLTGHINMTFNSITSPESTEQIWVRQQTLDESVKTYYLPKQPDTSISMTNLDIQADRGKLLMRPLTMASDDFYIEIQGMYDLLSPKQGLPNYKFNFGCKQIAFKLFNTKENSIWLRDECENTRTQLTPTLINKIKTKEEFKAKEKEPLWK